MTFFRLLWTILFFLTLSLAAMTADTIGQYTNASTKKVEVSSEEIENRGGYSLYASNKYMVDVFLSLSFPSLNNLAPSETIPLRTLIPANSEKVFLLYLETKNIQRSFGYKISFTYAYGNPETVQPNTEYLYWMPFEHATKQKITQGFNGRFSHRKDNQYAVDFDLVQGTAVYSARPGLVVAVKQDSRVGGRSAHYASYANYILIKHSDGTFGNYVHLRYGSALVKLGDYVDAGTHIGYSGNTGISTGPHLHFDVRVPTMEGTMQSIPIYFLDVDGESILPEENQYHYAYHPGKPDFTPVYGKNINIAQYKDYQSTIAQSNAFDTRTEQIDYTYILFFQNGYDKDYSVTFNISLRNMTAETELPITFTAPALSETFITILRADPTARQIYYAPSIKYTEIEQ